MNWSRSSRKDSRRSELPTRTSAKWLKRSEKSWADQHGCSAGVDCNGKSNILPHSFSSQVLRLVLAISLLLTCVVVGVATYLVLTEYEEDKGNQEYDALSSHALDSAVDGMQRVAAASQMLATAYSGSFPDPTSWPNVTLSALPDLVEDVADITGIRFGTFAPVVRPEEALGFEQFVIDFLESDPSGKEALGFEQFVIDFLESDPSFFPNIGKSSFGRGIFRSDPSSAAPDKRVHDISRDPSNYDNQYNLMFPLIQTSQMSTLRGSRPVFYDLHSDIDRGALLENSYSCVTDTADDSTNRHRCGVVTDILGIISGTLTDEELKVVDAQSVIYEPIILTQQPDEAVGFIGTIIQLSSLLDKSLPKTADGLDFVFETDTVAYTYKFKNGKAELVGEGDLYHSDYDGYRKRGKLLEDEVGVSSLAKYTVAVYPSEEYFDSYSTDTPIFATIAAVALIIFCSLLFVAYDVSMNWEFNRAKAVLNTRQTYVRFISHEVRTPLNIVKLGLSFLEEELKKFLEEYITAAADDDNELSTSSSAAPLINYPIASVSNYLRSIVEKAVNTFQDTTYDLTVNIDHAVGVMDDLLNYDKIESGTLHLELSRVPIWAIIERVSKNLIAAAAQKGVTLHTSLPSMESSAVVYDVNDIETGVVENHDDSSFRHVGVIGDSIRLAQVLRNLFSNALKFTPEGGDIYINAELIDSATTKVTPPKNFPEKCDFEANYQSARVLRLSIKDTSVGMTTQQTEQLFKEGVQFNAAELQAGQGSGLGLYIAKGVVENHGGHMMVSSEGLNCGTTFTIELQAYDFGTTFDAFNDHDGRIIIDIPENSNNGRSERDFSIHNGQDSSHEEPSRFAFGSYDTPSTVNADCDPEECKINVPLASSDPPQQKVVMVVDDSAMNRKFLTKLLKNKGYSCMEASDGEHVIEVYSEHAAEVGSGEAPSLSFILMDFEMPNMNGPDCTKTLRQIGYAGLIIGLTENVLQADIDYFTMSGANEVLAKPLDFSKLQEILDKASPL